MKYWFMLQSEWTKVTYIIPSTWYVQDKQVYRDRNTRGFQGVITNFFLMGWWNILALDNGDINKVPWIY
jgi:hypothetical protein